MQEKVQKESISPEKVAEIRKNLPCGFGKIIEEMIASKYKCGTINKMFIGARTMQPLVYDAANKLIETINNLKTNSNENNL